MNDELSFCAGDLVIVDDSFPGKVLSTDFMPGFAGGWRYFVEHSGRVQWCRPHRLKRQIQSSMD